MKVKKIIILKYESILILEDESKIKILNETFLNIKIKENMEIDLDNLCQINSYYKCLKYALRLLKNKDYSKLKLQQKLLNKFKKDTVFQVLLYINEHHYINEENSIYNIINKMINNNDGPNKIKNNLVKKGYKIDHINFNDFNYNIDKSVNKYLKINENIPKTKIKQKLYRFLINKGYNIIDINEYMKGREIEYDK